MDIYSEIRSENTTKLIETPFGGRFCGPIPPRRRVSLYQGIALSFFTDKNITQPNIFSGIYRFINACKFCPILFLRHFINDVFVLSISSRISVFVTHQNWTVFFVSNFIPIAYVQNKNADKWYYRYTG